MLVRAPLALAGLHSAPAALRARGALAVANFAMDRAGSHRLDSVRLGSPVSMSGGGSGTRAAGRREKGDEQPRRMWQPGRTCFRWEIVSFELPIKKR